MKPFPVRGSMPAATAATIALVALADFSLDGRLGGFGVAVPLAASFAVALLLHRKSGFRPVMVAAMAGAFATAAISEIGIRIIRQKPLALCAKHAPIRRCGVTDTRTVAKCRTAQVIRHTAGNTDGDSGIVGICSWEQTKIDQGGKFTGWPMDAVDHVGNILPPHTGRKRISGY